MEKLLQMVMYFAWALWLIYSYGVLFRRRVKPDLRLIFLALIGLVTLMVLLKSRMMILFTIIALLIILFGMFRRSGRKEADQSPPIGPESHSPVHSLLGMALVTIVLLSLFFSLSADFQSDSTYFIERYNFKIEPGKNEIVIGNSKELSDIVLENRFADKAHLRLILNGAGFFVQNISDKRKVDLNGRYLNKLELEPGDEITIRGKEKIRVLEIGRQYPLGRSLRVAIVRPGHKEEILTLHTLLNKPFFIGYERRNDIKAGLNKLALPGAMGKSVAILSYEPLRQFLGMNVYYFFVFLLILLLSTGIYLYLRNRFNGALLLLLMAYLPFMAGMVPLFAQALITLAFVPFIFYVQKRRKPAWHWGAFLLVIMFAGVLLLPLMLRMDGDFTFRYHDFSQKESIEITRDGDSFQLKDIKKRLAYGETHRVILGHTAYQLFVTRDKLSLTPVDPEKIKISPDYKAIICDLSQVAANDEPDNNYIYLEYPRQFEPVPAPAAAGKDRLVISDGKGDSLTLSKIVNENYKHYLRGLILFIIIPFWIFWLLSHFGFPLGKTRTLRLKLFNPTNIVIYNFVFFMLGLGYVMFGALALYNNYYLENFEKFRVRALPLFVAMFFLTLIVSKYNRWLVFLYRLLKQKKYHVPLIAGLIPIFLANYGKLFLIAGILFLIFVFAIRLRRDIHMEFKNTQSQPLNIRKLCETTISSFENPDNQRILFGLGKILNKKGWNYLLVSDLFLLLALFFIVLQAFLGGELGVAVAGFFFLPIEMGKILLTIYFADWVSRIDKGMELSVLWIYGLVSIPFFLLIIFLKDFSPLVVFSFVFLYHIVKIDKPLKFKLLLLALIVVTLVLSVSGLADYSFPFEYLAVVVSLLLAVWLLRIWFKKTLSAPFKALLTLALVIVLVGVNYFAFFHAPPAPRTLGGRISSWFDPWRDYNLSYQYVNSLWLMKGTGTFGKSTDALTAANHVPLIEKDLSLTLYISVLGTIGIAFIFFTLFLVAAYVHKLVHRYGGRSRGSPARWYLYLLEFLTVIFLAQFLVPALYVVGLLPIMGQPLPFLSYSNNMLLLFALPIAFLMIVLGNNLAAEEE